MLCDLSAELPDDNSEREPPDSIPNSEVKPLSADGSVGLPHVRVGHCQASKSKGLILRDEPFFSFIRSATEILWNSRLVDSMILYPATVYQPRRRPYEVLKYLSACALDRTKRPEIPVYCLRHYAVDTRDDGWKNIFLVSRINRAGASHQSCANSPGHSLARCISFGRSIFSDIDYGGYLRK